MVKSEVNYLTFFVVSVAPLWRKILTTVFLTLLFTSNLSANSAGTLPLQNAQNGFGATKKPQLAIIIDDIGGKASDKQAFSLSKKITFSILPHTEFSTAFSYKAASQNREVMLHMPMESLHSVNLGPGPLLANMYPQEVKSSLVQALRTVPHAVGVNNHMGSKLTQMTLQMTTFMQILHQNNLFFIDSRTTRFTKATTIAQAHGVKVASRHVFLDHVQKPEFLEQQFAKALAIAQKHDKAILIAHPYPVTLAFLQAKLAQWPDEIELITVSEYLRETDKFRVNPQLAATARELEASFVTAAPED